MEKNTTLKLLMAYNTLGTTITVASAAYLDKHWIFLLPTIAGITIIAYTFKLFARYLEPRNNE